MIFMRLLSHQKWNKCDRFLHLYKKPVLLLTLSTEANRPCLQLFKPCMQWQMSASCSYSADSLTLIHHLKGGSLKMKLRGWKADFTPFNNEITQPCWNLSLEMMKASIPPNLWCIRVDTTVQTSKCSSKSDSTEFGYWLCYNKCLLFSSG